MNILLERETLVSDTVSNFIFPSKFLPSCFKNDDIFENMDNIINSFSSFDDLLNIYFKSIENSKLSNFITQQNIIYGAKKGTEPINFIISKPLGGSRTLSICNPLIFILLHYYLVKNNDVILSEQITDSEVYLSNSRYTYDNDYFIPSSPISYEDFFSENYEKYYLDYFFQLNYTSAQKKNILMSNGCYYCLKMDISNFFNNIYSHEISWHLIDENNKTTFENIDTLSRLLNNNETKGILTGPYTSSLISELIMSKVDRKIKDKIEGLGVYCVRYCDDYCFYSNSKEVLTQKIIPFVEKCVMEFKLDINPNKTVVLEFPFFDPLYDIKTKTKELLNYVSSDEYNEFDKVEKIISSIDFEIKRKPTSTNYILKALLNSFEYKFINQDNLSILIDYLINLMFKYDFLSKFVSEFILKLLLNSNIDFLNLVEKWLNKRNDIEFNVKNITDIFLAYMIIKLNVSSNLIDCYMLNILKTNDICAILSFEYFINFNLVSNYKDELKKYVQSIKDYISKTYSSNLYYLIYYSKYWLFLYINFTRWHLESVRGFKQFLNHFNFLDPSNSLYNDRKLDLLRVLSNYKIFDI